MDEALALAERIAKNAPLAVRASKRVMKQAGELPDAEAWAVNNAAVRRDRSARPTPWRAPIAFAEKREPNWTGK